MPPRFVYWTILIDGKPTAFRARDREELLPTVNQLKRKNEDVVVKWFARGKLWDSPEAEREAQYRPQPPTEKRTGDWRPGGTHKDPRDRFKKKNRPERAWSEADRDRDRPPRREGERKPWETMPGSPPPRRSSQARPPSGGAWQKPSGPSGPPRRDRPWTPQPGGDRKPWRDKPAGPANKDRPWQTKPSGPRAQRKPWQNKPAGPPRGDRPWSAKPRGRPPFPKKKRDDEPPDRG